MSLVTKMKIMPIRDREFSRGFNNSQNTSSVTQRSELLNFSIKFFKLTLVELSERAPSILTAGTEQVKLRLDYLQ